MLLASIRVRNLLSLKDCALTLRPLNVLIGTNASGKSNLIEAISLLHAAPVDLQREIFRGGGVREWIWKGRGVGKGPLVASLECRVHLPSVSGSVAYRLSFAEEGPGLHIREEQLDHVGGKKRKRYLDRRSDQVRLSGLRREPSPVSGTESVLARFKSPGDTTPVTSLGRAFEQIRIYREFNTGPTAPARTGVSTAGRKDYLSDGGENLALVLNEMEYNNSLDRLKGYFGRLAEGFRDVHVRLEGGVARVYVREDHLSEPTPANRLSDGTLKFLCLMAILLDPRPPALICIEEPELGLHPDAVQLVAEALTDAAERTQLIVTTHSEALVDAFSDQPEAVVVCDRDFDRSTRFGRLSTSDLEAWLRRYSLGELWRKGEIGGNLS